MEDADREAPAQPVEVEVSAKPDAPETGKAITGIFRGRGENLDETLGATEWILVTLSYLLLLLTFPISIWLCLQVVNEYEQAVILRLGHIRKGGTIRPGVYFILPCIDVLIRVDMRMRLLSLPFQEVLTKDPLSLDVDSAVYYRIENAALAVRNVADPDSATLLLAQTTLGNILGTKYLSQIVCNREKIAQNVQSIVGNAISAWGIKVEQVEIRTVKTRVKAEQPVARPGGSWSPASTGRRTSLHSFELKEKLAAVDTQTNTPRTMKESSVTITGSPTSLKFHCMKTETTGGIIHQSSTSYALSSSRNGALTEGPDFGEACGLTCGSHLGCFWVLGCLQYFLFWLRP